MSAEVRSRCDAAAEDKRTRELNRWFNISAQRRHHQPFQLHHHQDDNDDYEGDDVVEWTSYAWTFDELFRLYARKLPIIVRSTRGYYGQPGAMRLDVGQVMQVCSYCRQLRIQAIDASGRRLSLPIHYQLRLLSTRGGSAKSWADVRSKLRRLQTSLLSVDSNKPNRNVNAEEVKWPLLVETAGHLASSESQLRPGTRLQLTGVKLCSLLVAVDINNDELQSEFNVAVQGRGTNEDEWTDWKQMYCRAARLYDFSDIHGYDGYIYADWVDKLRPEQQTPAAAFDPTKYFVSSSCRRNSEPSRLPETDFVVHSKNGDHVQNRSHAHFSAHNSACVDPQVSNGRYCVADSAPNVTFPHYGGTNYGCVRSCSQKNSSQPGEGRRVPEHPPISRRVSQPTVTDIAMYDLNITNSMAPLIQKGSTSWRGLPLAGTSVTSLAGSRTETQRERPRKRTTPRLQPDDRTASISTNYQLRRLSSVETELRAVPRIGSSRKQLHSTSLCALSPPDGAYIPESPRLSSFKVPETAAGTRQRSVVHERRRRCVSAASDFKFIRPGMRTTTCSQGGLQSFVAEAPPTATPVYQSSPDWQPVIKKPGGIQLGKTVSVDGFISGQRLLQKPIPGDEQRIVAGAVSSVRTPRDVNNTEDNATGVAFSRDSLSDEGYYTKDSGSTASLHCAQSNIAGPLPSAYL